MKKILLSILTLGALTSSLNAVGTCTTLACSGVTVDTLFMTAAGDLYIGTSGDERALNCAAGAPNGGLSNVYVSLAEGDIGKNSMYALLLTAKTTGTTVTVRIEEGHPTCKLLYVIQ